MCSYAFNVKIIDTSGCSFEVEVQLRDSLASEGEMKTASDGKNSAYPSASATVGTRLTRTPREDGDLPGQERKEGREGRRN